MTNNEGNQCGAIMHNDANNYNLRNEPYFHSEDQIVKGTL